MKFPAQRPASALRALLVLAAVCPSAQLFAQSTLSATTEIKGGAAGTGSFLWNNTGNLISSPSPLLLNGLPADGDKALVWDAAKGSLLSGQWFLSGLVGSYSAAFGSSWAVGDYSFASGISYAGGPYSSALGISVANGEGSFAAAFGSAYGVGASAFGPSWAVGEVATSIGEAYAMGDLSFAGGKAVAYGSLSTALGMWTQANAYASLVIGRLNVGTVDVGGETAWLAVDPIFEIGIGTPGTGLNSPEIRANALTVYKDGTVIISKAQGDISMGEFGN